MAKISGKGGWVQVGILTIAEMTEWSISGASMETIKGGEAFGDTFVTKIASGLIDPGQVTFKGNYDPSDDTGQRSLITTLKTGSGITNLYLYANTSTFWRVASGGEILITKADAVTLPRNGIGTIDFAGEVSDAEMEQIGVGT